MERSKAAFPDGHFYSPVVDINEAAADQERIWPPAREPGPLAHLMKTPPFEPTVQGIDWNSALHEELLREHFPRLIEGYDYAESSPDDEAVDRYHEGNSQFGHADARVLFCMLRLLTPKRIVEVGAGYSTLLIADVNDRFLGGTASITCVEPYPRPFLHRLERSQRIRLLQQRAQDVDAGVFDQLGRGDLLFIDSSHVSKTGSDVNRLFLDVLPRLKPGVVIHVHDIFFPDDYPKSWVLDEGFSWNEQYLLQALLTGNARFRTLYGGSVARAFHRASLVNFFGRMVHGSSFWMEKLV